MDVVVKSPVKKSKVWKRIRKSFRASLKINKPDRSGNLGLFPATILESTASPESFDHPPLPPPNAAFKSQTEEATGVSSLPFMKSPTWSTGNKDEGFLNDDKVLLVEQHTTADRNTSTSSPSYNVKQSSKGKKIIEQKLPINEQARREESTLTEHQPSYSLVSELCVEQYMGDNSCLVQESIQLEFEVKRALKKINSLKSEILEFKDNEKKVSLTAKDATNEVEIVRRLKETVHILEADAAANKQKSKDQWERIIEQRLVVDQLEGTQKNLKQVVSDLQIQSEKLSKALQKKNRDLFKGLANVNIKLYQRDHVRRLELTAKVLAEKLAQVRAEGDSPDENVPPNTTPESISEGKFSPKVSGLKKGCWNDPKVISPLQEARIRSDLELKKREAFDIKLKFFEIEMEVSRLKSILQRNRRSQDYENEEYRGVLVKNKRRSAYKGTTFKQHRVTNTISEGGPYELPVDYIKKSTPPPREQNASERVGNSRVRSYSMGGKINARKQRVKATSKPRKTMSGGRMWKK